jgi:TonB family protein
MTQRLPARIFIVNSALIGFLVCCASTLQSQEAPPERIRVGEDAMRGVLVKKVAPVYPPLARQARIQGTVILNVVIDKSGNVYDVQLVSGHPMLAPAAVEAVKQWKYRPYLLNGEPVEVETTVQVIFRLQGKPAPGAPQIIPFSPTETEPPRPLTPQRIRVSSGVAQGLLVSKVNPEYPPEARKQHVQGVVFLKVNIDKEGNVCNVELIEGHPLLAPATIDAVKQWKYRPYLLNGTPLEVETQVQVNFTLTGN